MNGSYKTLFISALAAASLSGCIKDKHPKPDVEPKAVEVPVAPLGGTVVTGDPRTRGLGPLDRLEYNEVYMAYGESDPGPYEAEPRYTKALRGLITYCRCSSIPSSGTAHTTTTSI